MLLLSISIFEGPLITFTVFVIQGNNFTVAYAHDEQGVENVPLTVEVELREWNFHHWSGGPVTREQMMMLLLSVEKLYIRAYYNSEVNEAR